MLYMMILRLLRQSEKNLATSYCKEKNLTVCSYVSYKDFEQFAI